MNRRQLIYWLYQLVVPTGCTNWLYQLVVPAGVWRVVFNAHPNPNQNCVASALHMDISAPPCIVYIYVSSTDLFVDGRMDGWMDGWMDEWMDGWGMDGWMDGWMDAWMSGWMDGWLDEWMSGGMDGWHMQTLHQQSFFHAISRYMYKYYSVHTCTFSSHSHFLFQGWLSIITAMI